MPDVISIYSCLRISLCVDVENMRKRWRKSPLFSNMLKRVKSAKTKGDQRALTTGECIIAAFFKGAKKRIISRHAVSSGELSEFSHVIIILKLKKSSNF